MDDDAKKGLSLLLCASLVLLIACREQIQQRKLREHRGRNHHQLHYEAEEETILLRNRLVLIGEIALSLSIAMYASFSKRFSQFGRFREIREEVVGVSGLCVEGMSDFMIFNHRKKFS
jgi:hypothetical protein